MSTVLDKGCDILIQLRERPEQTCRELATRLKRPKNSVYWLLAVLLDRGFIERRRVKREFAKGSPPYTYSLAEPWKGR